MSKISIISAKSAFAFTQRITKWPANIRSEPVVLFEQSNTRIELTQGVSESLPIIRMYLHGNLIAERGVWSDNPRLFFVTLADHPTRVTTDRLNEIMQQVGVPYTMKVGSKKVMFTCTTQPWEKKLPADEWVSINADNKTVWFDDGTVWKGDYLDEQATQYRW